MKQSDKILHFMEASREALHTGLAEHLTIEAIPTPYFAAVTSLYWVRGAIKAHPEWFGLED